MRLLILLFPCCFFADLLDLTTFRTDFVLETKQVKIPGFPYAFNPSMVRWKGFILMSFRTIPDPTNAFVSLIGVALLDREFNPIGEPQILETREEGSSIPPRGEDARLIYLGEKLLIVYSDNKDAAISRGGFRMVVGELEYNQGIFSISHPTRLVEYEKQCGNLREKNWVPFEYRENLFLAYSISPHLIYQPIPYTGACITASWSDPRISWDWGILRGGTPALPLDTGEYLSFFHSVKMMESIHSKGKSVPHYFMGAYTFSSHPPFQITKFSPLPIVGPGFYSGTAYKPYWDSIQCVFPAGLLIDPEFIWISYGRQDHEIWVAKLDKQKLLSSLLSVPDD